MIEWRRGDGRGGVVWWVSSTVRMLGIDTVMEWCCLEWKEQDLSLKCLIMVNYS